VLAASILSFTRALSADMRHSQPDLARGKHILLYG
jgi:hypothetical protein